jgi:hypothetical protein
MSDHDSEQPEWMRELDAELPSLEDLAEERMRLGAQVSEILRKYLPGRAGVPLEELLALMTPEERDLVERDPVIGTRREEGF